MYLPNHFEQAREEELLRTIAAYPINAANELRQRGEQRISEAMLGTIGDGNT